MRLPLPAGLDAGRNRCQFLLTLPMSLSIGGLYGVELARWTGEVFTVRDVEPVAPDGRVIVARVVVAK